MVPVVSQKLLTTPSGYGNAALLLSYAWPVFTPLAATVSVHGTPRPSDVGKSRYVGPFPGGGIRSAQLAVPESGLPPVGLSITEKPDVPAGTIVLRG